MKAPFRSLALPATVENDASLEYAELNGYKFYVRERGSPSLPPVIAIHGGPGGDSRYLYPIEPLASDYRVIFYDQRGAGLSPRVDKASLTLESNLSDLHSIVEHYGSGHPVRLIGHSWGAMLAIGYLGRHPERVSHAVAVEPGMLTPAAAREFVRRLKASQSWRDAMPMLRYILQTPFVRVRDGHERFDYVMTRLMNRTTPGGPLQCEGQSMPPNAFARAGYAAFANMLKPVLDRPERFTHDLTQNCGAYAGKLLMLSSECSQFGYKYQRDWHMPQLPPQTAHVEAKAMGHNMLTLNPAWSMSLIAAFFRDGSVRPPPTV